jgi:AraC-like DNA-binding protein
LRIEAVRFAHRATREQAARHRAYFATKVEFGAGVTELVFGEGVLDAALPTADPDLLAILLPVAEEKRARPGPPALFTDQVRRALRAVVSPEDAQLAAVARGLGMTARSVQRRLGDEGTVFQDVRDDVRREVADRCLAQGMSSPEISFLLGFSEPSAFFRAFRRWTGLTPLERRAALVPAMGR